jgi:hypothetical protein
MIAALKIVILVALVTESMAAEKESVWFWFQSCGAAKMRLEVTLDGAAVYNTTVPICKRVRDSAKRKGQQRVLKYSFASGRMIRWEGYLDENNATKAGQPIEGNVWQAGANPDALILGRSFETGNQVYMNTLHVARPGILERMEIIPGLVFITYPIQENPKLDDLHSGELHEYFSPDGRLKALVIPLPKAPYGSGESRIELRSTDGTLLFSKSYASEDGEHGYGVEHAAWTPDSRFFVYSLSSSGGHQARHFPTDFIKVSTLSVHRLDEYVGPITDPDFKVFPPDIVCADGRGIKDLEETTFKVRLSELVNRKKP